MTLCPISSSLNAARCPTCGTLTDLGGALVRRPRREATPLMPAPNRWRIDDGPRAFSATWRKFTVQSLFLVPFAAFWNGILIAMAGGVTQGFTHPERLLWGLLVPHTWVGLGLLYAIGISFFNRTRVEAKGGVLTVKQGPLPTPGNRRLDVGDIDQLFVLEKRGNRGAVSYELCAVTREGRRVSVVSGLSDAQDARFLEVRLEQALDLKDRPVEGEVPRAR